MKNKEQIIFFASNLKLLRERKKMTQEVLADKLGIKRGKLAAWETGLIKSPQPEDYIHISECLKISIDTLLKIDLRRLTELKLRDLEAGNDVYIQGGNLRVVAVTVDSKNKENIEDVPVNAQAGYIEGYGDPQFIASLPKFRIPELSEKGTFRRFPIQGDSMLIPEGSKVIGKYVTDWQQLNAATPCIVVLKTASRPVFKLVTMQKETGGFLLESLHPDHDPFTVAAEQVAEFWRFQSFSSDILPEKSSSLVQLEKMIKAMQQDIQSIKEK